MNKAPESDRSTGIRAAAKTKVKGWSWPWTRGADARTTAAADGGATR